MGGTERSRSRSPVNDFKDDCYLFIGNLPDNWHLHQILSFLRRIIAQETYVKQIGFVYLLKDEDVFKGEVVVEFLTATACNAATNALQDADIDGRKLKLVPRAKNRVPNTFDAKKLRDRWYGSGPAHQQQREEKKEIKKQHQQGSPKPTLKTLLNVHMKKFRKHETYGLSTKFLSDLSIEPPLTNRLFLSNLPMNVTETKLREVFSYAGHVVAVSMVHKSKTVLARVLFDHPVEAVQAISMFHNKELYGKSMCVKMDLRPEMPIVPADVSSIGLGLGPNGEPLTAVRHTLELEPLKNLLLKELDKVQEKNNSRSNQSGCDDVPNQQNDMSGAMWNNNQPNDGNAGNPLNYLMQILQQNMGGNVGLLNLALQQAMVNQNMPNQIAFGNQNVPDQNVYGNPNMLNQSAFGNQNVPDQGVYGNQNVPNQSAFGNQQPQSRFDVPPSAMLAQNAMVNQNELVQQLAAYQQTSNVWQTQQAAPRSRFDIPPSGVSAQNIVSGQNWTSGNWSQTQTPNQSSSYDKNDNGYGNSKSNSDTFDVQKPSDIKKPDKPSDMLLFTNLPSSVTSQALVNKMTEVGPLKFAEITGQGRAIVRFQTGRDAERCLRLYDRSKVDGQVIAVKFI